MLASRRSRKSQRGAAALEFALVLPVLIMLLVGVVDLGLLMSAQSVVSNAAREGARTAALGGNSFAAQNAAKAAYSFMPGAATVGTGVEVTCKTVSGDACSLNDSTPDTGGVVTIKVTYVHAWLSPLLLGMSPTITLQAQSYMRIE